MRLLHTSDWHLGQDFYKFDRTYEHQQFLSWLLQTLVEKNVDVLLIAGDVFDVSNPSAQAQRMFFEFLVEARRRSPDLQTIVIAGNHDSGARLEAPAHLLKSFAVTVVGRVTSSRDGLSANDKTNDQFLIPLYSKQQKSSDPAAICLALPFLRAADVQWTDDLLSYPDAIVRAYEQGIAMAREQYGDKIPLIGMGHFHARGGQSSMDSERRLVIGGEEAVLLGSLAEQFAYFALGHLHLPQSVGGHGHVRYSGSPLPMSFSELHYPHQAVLVDLADGRVSVHEPLRVPRAVNILRCPKEVKPFEDALRELSALELPECAVDQQPYLEVPIRLSGPTPDYRVRIEEALKGKPVRLVKITPSRAAASSERTQGPLADLAGLAALRQLDPVLIFSDVHQRKYSTQPDDEIAQAFSQIMRELAEGGEA